MQVYIWDNRDDDPITIPGGVIPVNILVIFAKDRARAADMALLEFNAEIPEDFEPSYVATVLGVSEKIFIA